MKFSSAITLALAPLALAKVARNSRTVKRDSHLGAAGHLGGGGVALGNVVGGGLGHLGAISGVHAVIVWVNQGGGIPAQTLNQQVTVTQTITVPAGAAPTAINGVQGSTTIAPGATGVVAGTGATHSVSVGGPGGLSFFPQEVSAQVGDMIIFTFYGQNHTVTQSSFDLPCDPLAGGMDSGFMPNPDNSIVPPPQVAMQVMTEEPLWMYCAQGNHCGRGMAFSINPNAERTHAQFQANAIAQRGGDLPGTAITGGPGAAPADAAPPPPPAPEGSAVDANLPASSGSLPAPLPPVGGATPSIGSGLPAPSLPPTVGNSAVGSIVMGQGTLNPDGSCQCAVQCGSVGGFPDPANQGVNAFGGVAGSISMNAAGVPAPAAPLGSVAAASGVSVSLAAPTPIPPPARRV